MLSINSIQTYRLNAWSNPRPTPSVRRDTLTNPPDSTHLSTAATRWSGRLSTGTAAGGTRTAPRCAGRPTKKASACCSRSSADTRRVEAPTAASIRRIDPDPRRILLGWEIGGLAGCLFGNGNASVSVGFEGPKIQWGRVAKCRVHMQLQNKEPGRWPLRGEIRSASNRPTAQSPTHPCAAPLDLANTDDDLHFPTHANRTLAGR